MVSTILTTMNIISFEERTFEGIAAKFEYFVQHDETKEEFSREFSSFLFL